MKIQTLNLTLIAVLLVMSASGCASLSITPTAKTGTALNTQSPPVELRFGMARILERNGKLEDARKAYLEILEGQSHPESLHRLGVTAIRQNRLEDGLKHLSEAIAVGDPSAELLGDYGYGQFLAGELSAAEATLKKAVSVDPSQKRNINNLAIVIGKQNRLKESFELFRQASPEAEALANIAFIQSQSNELGEARENYNRALDLDPKLKIAALGLVEVDRHINNHREVNQAPAPAAQETGTEQSALWSQPAKPAKAAQPVIASSVPKPTSTPSADHGFDPTWVPGRASSATVEAAPQDPLSSIARLIDAN